MKVACFLGCVIVVVSGLGCQSAVAGEPVPKTTTTKATPLDLSVNDIGGKKVDIKSLRGSVLLIVNVASECGYTPQYAELQQLYARYKDRGLLVLGFPSNDFGGQEPAEGAAIQKFASDEYGVTFPLFEKVHASGPQMSPLYQTLTTQKGAVKWNFTKFLVDDKGVVVARFDSAVTPLAPELLKAVEALLPPKG